VLAWMERMKAFGHGTSQPINEAQALQAAKAEPRLLQQRIVKMC
jgi:hypothetical protein